MYLPVLSKIKSAKQYKTLTKYIGIQETTRSKRFSMPTSILLIDKTGTIKSMQVKDYNETDLYKKAGFKSADGFALQHVWPVTLQNNSYSIHVFAKTQGRAGQENKYDFPPPIDKTLFFGTCVVVNKTADQDVTDLSVKTWEAIYEHLFGGFEDIGSEDSEESDDDDEEEGPRTKEGYLKDGFIVDDDDEDSDYSGTSGSSDDSGSDSSASEPSARKPGARKAVARKASKGAGKVKPTKIAFASVAAPPVPVPTANIPVNVFNCTGELVEEDYV